MHTVLGILVDTLRFHFGYGWSVSNILENGRRLGHIIGKRLILMHLYTTPHRSRYIVNVYTPLVVSLGHDLWAPPFQKCIQVEKRGGIDVGANVRSLQAPQSLHSPAHWFCILPKLMVRLNICRYLAASAENIWTFPPHIPAVIVDACRMCKPWDTHTVSHSLLTPGLFGGWVCCAGMMMMD